MTISLPASSDSSGSARPSSSGGGGKDQHPECLDGLLTGRPLVCLAFNDMLVRCHRRDTRCRQLHHGSVACLLCLGQPINTAVTAAAPVRCAAVQMKVEQPRRLALPAAAADAADAAPQLQPQPLVHAFAAVLPWAGAATAAR
jgi:hypothetical protein